MIGLVTTLALGNAHAALNATLNIPNSAVFRPNLLATKIIKPLVKTPIRKRLAAVSPDKFGPNTKVTVGLYDKDGNVNGSKVMTGKQIENDLGNFTRVETTKFTRLNTTLGAANIRKLKNLKLKTRVLKRRVFDRELNEEIEVVEIPQDLTVANNLVIQRTRLRAIPLKPLVRPIVARPVIRRPVVVGRIPSGPTHAAKPYSKKTSYDKTWGSKSRFSAYLNASAESYGSRARRTAKGYFKAGGYVFNRNIELVKFSARAERKNTSNSGHTYFKVLGQTKWETSASTQKRTLKFTREKSRRQRFWIGPLPVSVGGAIGGSIGASLNLYAPDAKSLAGTFEPFIDSYGAADAAIDVWLARAGIEGRLRIVKDSVPVSTTLKYNPNKQNLQFKLKVKNELRALDGKVSVYAKVRKLFGGWRKWSKTILSWSGFAKTWTLLDKNVTVNI